MFVDETRSDDGQLVGASAIILDRRGRRQLARCCLHFRRELPKTGIDSATEIHAATWVNEKDLFPGTNAFDRISELGRYLRAMSKCNGAFVINILVDTTLPGVAGTDVRTRIWETLFWEFENWLAERGLNGHVVFDKGDVGPVLAIARRLRANSLNHQPLEPEPADSRAHEELQLADVCAYFSLQRLRPANQVRKAGAANYIDRIARLCPDDRVPGAALIRDLQ